MSHFCLIFWARIGSQTLTPSKTKPIPPQPSAPVQSSYGTSRQDKDVLAIALGQGDIFDIAFHDNIRGSSEIVFYEEVQSPRTDGLGDRQMQRRGYVL